jgi:hypothetical protein
MFPAQAFAPGLNAFQMFSLPFYPGLLRFTDDNQQVTAIHDFGHNQLAFKGSNLFDNKVDW